MRRGFTLIELMIVIAIIAIIAAIAIPGLLAAQRSSNERNASASLKTLATAETDFRSNDRDRDRVIHFWVGNVYGLFALCPTTNGSATPTGTSVDNTLMIKLIEPSLAQADGNCTGTTIGCVTVAAAVGAMSPKANYVYRAFAQYQTTGLADYGTIGGIPAWGNNFNGGKFGFIAFPTSYTSGKQIYIMDESLSLFRADPGSGYSMSYTGGTSSSVSAWAGTIGGTAVTQAMAFPIAPGGVGWSKLD